MKVKVEVKVNVKDSGEVRVTVSECSIRVRM